MSPKPNEDDTASETLMQTQSYYNAADGLAANEATTEPIFGPTFFFQLHSRIL